MAISERPSHLSLPQTNAGVTTVLAYLIIKFPLIDAHIWQQRVQNGKVHYHDGSLVTLQSLFQRQRRIYYYREVESEPVIPFKEDIIFHNQHILVAYKPHFLPVTPGGIYVNECLQNRLRARTGIDKLQALHRLDRVTAGLVIFSTNPDTRRDYHGLFQSRKIHKTYQAIASINKNDRIKGCQWEIKNRIVQGDPKFCMRVAQGDANSHSVVRCLQQSNGQALFELNPITGKTHQLRIHMHTLGWPILNERYYPKLQPLSKDDYSAPLQLLAKQLAFIDPITQKPMTFSCERNLSVCI